MPVKGKVAFWNHEGNQLEGPEEDQSSYIFEFSHNVYLPYDKEQNKITGTRRISSFMLVKDIDKLTPQLYDIVCNGRKCTQIQVTLYRVHADSGEEEEYLHYLLEEAKIIAVDNYMLSTKLEENEPLGHQERVSMLAKRFTWKFLEGGIEYQEETV